MTEISAYSSPKAFGHRLVQEVLDGDVSIQEKIDGSQISFGVLDGELMVRSRNTQLDLDDPGMFGKAVQHIKSIQSKLIEGWIYRGEYLAKPKHNTLVYDRTPSGFICLFDIEVSMGTFENVENLAGHAEQLGIEAVPWYYTGSGENVSFDDIKWMLDNKEPLLGGKYIEGVVIKNYDQWLNDKVMMAKYVSPKFKERHQGDWKERNPGGMDKIKDSINREAIWNKAIQHLAEEGILLGEPKDIGPLMKEINQDFSAENKEDIKELLFSTFWKEILRYVGQGFPEYYKEKLADGSISNHLDTTYKACLFDNDQLIDTTFIDENDKELAWSLFKEFGHVWSDKAYITIDLEK